MIKASAPYLLLLLVLFLSGFGQSPSHLQTVNVSSAIVNPGQSEHPDFSAVRNKIFTSVKSSSACTEKTWCLDIADFEEKEEEWFSTKKYSDSNLLGAAVIFDGASSYFFSCISKGSTSLERVFYHTSISSLYLAIRVMRL